MLLLLAVLWLFGVSARDEPRSDKYVIKRLASCPDVGYTFRRETSPNALAGSVCHLCFCQDDGTAVCWPRENKRCDAAHYQHGVGKRKYDLPIKSCPDVGYTFGRETSPNALVGYVCHLCFCQDDGTAVCWPRENKRCDATHYQHAVGKRETRVRRSPVGLSDIFFRDAARDLFDKQVPQTCKPYETSFSEGCPPADWCVGCTVCDCDAHGHWDCHILSFCPDKKDKHKMKQSKKPLRSGRGGLPKRTTTKIKLTTNRNLPKRTALTEVTANIKKQIKANLKNISRAKPPNKNMKLIKKMNVKSDTNTHKGNNVSPKPLIIKKDTKHKNPKVLKSTKPQQLHQNATDKITQEVFKKVIAAMKTFLDKRILSVETKPANNLEEKRSVAKRSAANGKNKKNTSEKVNGNLKPITSKKQITKPVVPKNNNKKNVKNVKKLIKSNKKGVTTKRPTKVTKTKRTKRDVDVYNITETLVIENSSYINTVTIMPKLTLTEQETVTNEPGTSNYYKYSLITPTSSANNREEYPIVYVLAKNETNNNKTYMHQKSDSENHFDKTQAIVQNSSAADIRNDSSIEYKKTVIKSLPDFNDLKFNDWPQVKLLKNSLLIKKLRTVNSTKNNQNVSDLSAINQKQTINKYPKIKNIGRVLSLPSTSRKQNQSKIINTVSCHTIHSANQYHGNFKDQIYHKIDDLQNVLKRVLGEFRKNDTNKPKQKPKKFDVFKYLKKYFSKLFRRYRNKKKTTVNEQMEMNIHIIDSICESFSNCDMSQKNNPVLKYKLHELNKESYTIIKTIKIIKGLLHLLDVPTYTHDTLKPNKGKPNLKDDIRKLNAVLKDKYTNNHIHLTSTQITQIRYIKNNTHLFVQTVGRFANVLNEIINILTKKQNIDDMSKHAFKTAKRSYENNREMKNDTAGNFRRLKNLLLKYNMVQNTFVRKMYKLLSRFEKVHENDTKLKVSDENKVTAANIEHFSRNIINTLRKLKNLANMLNSRKKRDTARDDDPMDYLLTLMEFLLKQNYPLDAAPANDGIDLLIDAIKSAPDIKPIRKKVLQAMPVNIRISRTTEPVPLSVIKEESLAESGRASDDISSNNNRSETGEQNSYQEIEKEDSYKYQPGKNLFETDYDKGEPLATRKPLDATIISGSNGSFGNVEDSTGYNNFKKFEQMANASKKFEVFDSDLEDDEVEVTTSSTTPADLETDNIVTDAVPLESNAYTSADVKSKHYNNISSADVSGNSDGDKRVGLDWLDEGYEDSKEVKQVKTTMKTETTEPVVTTIRTIHVDNVSSMTKEDIDDEKRKKKVKINVEDVMLKKQMDLLNSLDYGTDTERSESDDQDSKEGDDRYPGDTFPAYFV